MIYLLVSFSNNLVMYMKNELGEKLNIVISCEHLYSHDWLAFVSWYSITRFLPDCKVHISCRRKNNVGQFFSWTKKVNINFILNKEVDLDNVLCIKPWIFAVREIDEEHLNLINFHDSKSCLGAICSPIKDDCFKPFVDCELGLGKFVLSEWINRVECPLSNMDKYMSLEVNFNEIRILSMMKQLAPLYSNVSRG